MQAFRDFVNEIAKLPETYFVSQRELLEWMMDPKPLSHMDEVQALQCAQKPPGAEVCGKEREQQCV